MQLYKSQLVPFEDILNSLLRIINSLLQMIISFEHIIASLLLFRTDDSNQKNAYR